MDKIAHTYKENVAIEIHDRIVEKHIKTLSKFIKILERKMFSKSVKLCRLSENSFVVWKYWLKIHKMVRFRQN